MSEFDAPDTFPAPHDLSLFRAKTALRLALGAIDLAIALFPGELRELNALDDLALCSQVLRKVAD